MIIFVTFLHLVYVFEICHSDIIDTYAIRLTHMKKIDILTPTALECLNLHGLDTDKLVSTRAAFDPDADNHGFPVIDLMVNPKTGNLLVLDGTHRALVAAENSTTIAGAIWDDPQEIIDPLVKVNFDRGPGFHDTAEILGIGSVAALLSKLATLRE